MAIARSFCWAGVASDTGGRESSNCTCIWTYSGSREGPRRMGKGHGGRMMMVGAVWVPPLHQAMLRHLAVLTHAFCHQPAQQLCEVGDTMPISQGENGDPEILHQLSTFQPEQPVFPACGFDHCASCHPQKALGENSQPALTAGRPESETLCREQSSLIHTTLVQSRLGSSASTFSSVRWG